MSTNYCKYCDYNASDKYRLKQHNETKKHANNVAKLKNKTRKLKVDNKKEKQSTVTDVLTCTLCGFTTRSKSGLTLHSRRCPVKIMEMEKQEKEREREERERKHIQDKIDVYVDLFIEKKIFKMKLGKKFSSYRGTCFRYDEFDPDRLSVVEDILNANRRKLLHVFLGQFILSLYGKTSNGPFIFSRHRLKVMIKVIASGNFLMWLLQKRGTIFIKNVAYFILDNVKYLMEEYADNFKPRRHSIKDALTSTTVSADAIIRAEALRIGAQIDKDLIINDIYGFIDDCLKIKSINGNKIPELI